MSHTDKSQISEKHRKFLNAWLETGNIKQSAIVAGYSAKTASAKGCNLLKDPRSKDYIQMMKQKILDEQTNTIANVNEIAEYLTRVMRDQEITPNGKRIAIRDKTAAAVELNRIIGGQRDETSHVLIIDGIVGNEDGSIED